MATSRKNSTTDTKKSQKQKSERKEKCGKCNNLVLEDHKGIECEICEKWFHAECEDLESAEYEVLSRHTKGFLHWYCHICNDETSKLMKTVYAMQEKQFKTEMELHKISKDTSDKFTRVEDDLLTIKKELSQMNQKLEATSKTDKDIETQIESKLGSVAADVEQLNKAVDSAKLLAAEEQDKENRRCNVILYRLPESSQTAAEERAVDDKRFCTQLLTRLNMGLTDEDIKKVVRLGKKGQATEPRPLLLQFGSRLAKNYTMESLYKIPHMESKFKNVIVAHDMTKKEREDCKELVQEAKQKTLDDRSGEWVFVVRGPPGQMRIIQKRRNH